MSRETIITNLKFTIELISNVPEDKLNMQKYVHPCGTIFCTLGWLALEPFIADQGLRISPDKTNLFGGHVYVDKTPYGDGDLDHLFGPDSFGTLFDLFGYGSFDKELGEADASIGITGGEQFSAKPPRVKQNHKRLALARLVHQLDYMEKFTSYDSIYCTDET